MTTWPLLVPDEARAGAGRDLGDAAGPEVHLLDLRRDVGDRRRGVLEERDRVPLLGVELVSLGSGGCGPAPARPPSRRRRAWATGRQRPLQAGREEEADHDSGEHHPEEEEARPRSHGSLLREADRQRNDSALRPRGGRRRLVWTSPAATDQNGRHACARRASTSATRPRRARRAPRALTVSELTERIQGVLETEFVDVWVEGEVSNLKLASSGHWYFSLKDDARPAARGRVADGRPPDPLPPAGRDEGPGARHAARLPAAGRVPARACRCSSRSARARCSRRSRS